MPARPRSFSIQVTRREAQVLSLLARGFSNEEIGASLELQTSTVKHFLCSAAAKLLPDISDNINSRVLLARYWSCELFRIGAGKG